MGHTPPKCPFLHATCHKCNKPGHIAPACRMKTSQPRFNAFTPPHRVKALVIVESEGVDNNQSEDLHLFRISRTSPCRAPIMCSLAINGQPLEMQVDTGADVSIISEVIRQRCFPHLTLAPTQVKLRTYSNEELQVMGKLFVTVEHNHQRLPLELLVVAGNGTSLMGRNWLQFIRLDWHHINNVHGNCPNSELTTLISQHHPLFREGLGTIKRHKASLQINTSMTSLSRGRMTAII